jgi:hypothetical protein
MAFSRRHLLIGLGGLTLLLAVVQVSSLFGARLESGDVFENYSTMKADPMGTMAIYNALGDLPQYDTLQYVRPFTELPDGNETTLVIAGATLGMDPPPILEALESFVSTGGRAVIAFRPLDNDFPLDTLNRTMRARDRARARKASGDSSSTEGDTEAAEPSRDSEEEIETPDGTQDPDEGDADTVSSGESSDADEDDAEENVEEKEDERFALTAADLKSEDISERWGFDYEFLFPLDEAVAERNVGTPVMEDELRIRTGLYFKPEDESWTPVFVRPDVGDEDTANATIMMRSWGAGSIVLCSDAYFLSNEALRKDRAPQLIQWAMSDNRTLLFSEVHLGNGQRDRIMTLVRRYRLHGFLACVLLVAGLFIWKNATTLLPRREQLLATRTAADKSQQAGLDNLLTRFLHPGALLPTCMQEWRQHFANSPSAPAVEKLFGSTAQEDETTKNSAALVAMYNRIAHEVRKGKP